MKIVINNEKAPPHKKAEVVNLFRDFMGLFDSTVRNKHETKSKN